MSNSYHSGALVTNTPWMWGANTTGNLGNQTVTSYSSPILVAGSHAFTKLAIGGYENTGARTLGLKSNGQVWAWGIGTYGELGNGSYSASKSSPVLVVGGLNFVDVKSGETFVIGLDINGTAWTWGLNTYGQLGQNKSMASISSPVMVVGNFGFTQIAAGFGNSLTAGAEHAVGLDTNGQAWCWGNNNYGQLGTYSTTSYSSPVAVVGNHSFIQIAAAYQITYGLKANGQVWAWGYGPYGELGDHAHLSASSPVLVVGGFNFTQISAGYENAAGLVGSTGQVWTWGDNPNGNLGNQTMTASSSPVAVVGAHSFVQVNAMRNVMMGLKANNQIWMWGWNGYGQLGTQNETSYSSPVLVVGPMLYTSLPDQPLSNTTFTSPYTWTWQSTSSTNMNLASNYAGGGLGTFATAQLVFPNTSGLAAAIATNNITCTTITVAPGVTYEVSMATYTLTLTGYAGTAGTWTGGSSSSSLGSGITIQSGAFTIASGATLTTSSALITLGQASTSGSATLTDNRTGGVTYTGISCLGTSASCTIQCGGIMYLVGAGPVLTIPNSVTFYYDGTGALYLEPNNTSSAYSFTSGGGFAGTGNIIIQPATGTTCSCPVLTYTGSGAFNIGSTSNETTTINITGNINVGTSTFNVQSVSTTGTCTVNLGSYTITCGAFTTNSNGSSGSALLYLNFQTATINCSTGFEIVNSLNTAYYNLGTAVFNMNGTGLIEIAVSTNNIITSGSETWNITNAQQVEILNTAVILGNIVLNAPGNVPGIWSGNVVCESFKIKAGVTLNPSECATSITLSNGNLTAATNATSTAQAQVLFTAGVSSGSFYHEILVGCNYTTFGVSEIGTNLNIYPGGDGYSWGYIAPGVIQHNGSVLQSGLASVVSGNTVGILYNATAGTIQFYVNGVAQGTAVSIGAGLTIYPSIGYTSYVNGQTLGTINCGVVTPTTYPIPSGANPYNANAFNFNGGTVTVTGATPAMNAKAKGTLTIARTRTISAAMNAKAKETLSMLRTRKISLAMNAKAKETLTALWTIQVTMAMNAKAKEAVTGITRTRKISMAMNAKSKETISGILRTRLIGMAMNSKGKIAFTMLRNRFVTLSMGAKGNETIAMLRTRYTTISMKGKASFSLNLLRIRAISISINGKGSITVLSMLRTRLISVSMKSKDNWSIIWNFSNLPIIPIIVNNTSKIHYAIEVYTASDLTNANYALVDGVFRFITDRPGYYGPESGAPEITYGPDEINYSTGASVGGNVVTSVFYEGFLQKAGITGNPARSIDISVAGSYSTDSSFQFKLRNDMKFWNFLQDPLNSGSYNSLNAIDLTGCIVLLWAVIDDVFYQIARGRITNNPYTETDYNFNVEDDATTIHKNIPPQISTYLGLSTLNQAIIQRQQGAVIPVVFGNVPYSPLGINQAVNTILQLNPPYYPAAATNYTSNPVTGVYTLTLYLPNPQTTPFIANDTRIINQYISVIAGDIGGQVVAATTKYYRIVSNTVGTIGSAQTITLTLVDPIILTTGIGSDTVLVPSDFNNLSNGCVLNPSSTANNDSDLPSAAYYSTSHTWWFQITDLAFSANVSQNPVQVYAVYSFESSGNYYDNDSGALQLLSTPESTIDLIANTLETNGNVTIFERINLTMINFGVHGLEVHSDPADIANVTDGDRSTSVTLNTNLTGWEPLPINANYTPQPTNPSALNQVLTQNYTALYFVMDFTLTPIGTWDGTIPLQIGFPPESIPSVQWEATDISGQTYRGTTTPHISTDLMPQLGSSTTYNINFLPDNLVKNSGTDNISLINAQANDTAGSPTIGYTYKASFYLAPPDTTTIPNLTANSIFTNPQITNINIKLTLASSTNEDPYAVFAITVKEIAIIGERSVNILGANLFAQTTGETIGNDGETFANTVYKAFRHILEDYDGINPALIDYGYGEFGVPNSRDTGERGNVAWPVSRTLTEQKISSDYLNELCQHSFVAMFSGRTGKRTLRTITPFLGSLTPTTGNGKTSVHNDSLIIIGTLGDYAKTDVSSLFNCFFLQYAYDPGSQQYVRGFNVNSLLIGYKSDGVTPQAFPAASTLNPDGSGNPYWWAYFSGMQVSATNSSLNYTQAQTIWNLCQAAYMRNRCSKPVQGDISELPWFTDSLIYNSTDSSGSGSSSPAYILLQLLATWATLQKETISYYIPINANTVETEMMDIVSFIDALLTNRATRNGWITGIEYDCTNDQIKVTLTLQPLELVG